MISRLITHRAAWLLRIVQPLRAARGCLRQHTSLTSSVGQAASAQLRGSRANLSAYKVVMVPFNIGCDFSRLSFQFWFFFMADPLLQRCRYVTDYEGATHRPANGARSGSRE